MSGPGHLSINQQSKRVILAAGFLIDNGTLDKREFEEIFRILLGNGLLSFNTIHEQLSSDESPEALLKRAMKNFENVTKNQNI
jgi:hypothetical protein